MDRSIGALVASLLLLPATVDAQVPPDSAAAAEPGDSLAAPDSAQGKQERSDFERMTEDATLQEGFFDAYLDDGRLLFVVPEDRLGERFLMSFEASTRVRNRSISTIAACSVPGEVFTARPSDIEC